MIYLSAQPDTQKFYWQLLVQVYNFQQMGIPLDSYHILVGLAQGAQPSRQMHHLQALGCRLYFYPFRPQSYISAMRPQLLQQHWERYPELEGEYVFYLDSDVVFRELPDYGALPFDGTWYLSNTRDYIGSAYIRGCGEGIFLDMCRAVHMDCATVVGGDAHAGGAQYLMRGATAAFFRRVQQDCVALWDTYRQNKAGYQRAGYSELQIWCADMWALLWGAWRAGHPTRIVPQLDFSWATSSVAQYEAKPILHLAGVAANNQYSGPYAPHFNKAAYNDSLPFGLDHSWVSPQSASSKYVALIGQVRQWVLR